MTRYWPAVVLFLTGSAILFAWTVTEHLLAMRRIRHEAVPELGPATFLVKDTEVMLLSVTGTYRRVGLYQLIVTDSAGIPHVIDRRDILEVHS